MREEDVNYCAMKLLQRVFRVREMRLEEPGEGIYEERPLTPAFTITNSSGIPIPFYYIEEEMQNPREDIGWDWCEEHFPDWQPERECVMNVLEQLSRSLGRNLVPPEEDPLVKPLKAFKGPFPTPHPTEEELLQEALDDAAEVERTSAPLEFLPKHHWEIPVSVEDPPPPPHAPPAQPQRRRRATATTSWAK